MKKYSFLVLILVLIFSCKKEDLKPTVDVLSPADTTQLDANKADTIPIDTAKTDTSQIDTIQADTPIIIDPTCPIDTNTYLYDTLGFEIIDSDYMYAEFIPSLTIQGWSFNEYQAGDVEVLASAGQCDGGCNNSIVADNGFDRSCGLVGCWYKYLTYMADDIAYLVNDSTTLISFFGDIDTKDEALFWAYANGYKMNYHSLDSKQNGIKEVDSGYELRTYIQVGSGCGSAIIRTAYHIHICPEGHITILSEEEVYNEISYICWD